MSFLYRLAANAKYVPYLLGSESKESFLSKNLNFNSGDYIDANNRVREIVGEEQVIIYGIHNLYYVDFNFDHESWADDNNYKYILSRGEKKLGKEYKKIYYDPLTNTYLYEKI